MKNLIIPFFVLALALASSVSFAQTQDTMWPRAVKMERNGSFPNNKPSRFDEAKSNKEARMKDAWAIFDSMSVESKKKFISEQKKLIDRRDSIQAAKRAEMEKRWAGFDTMSIDHQLELLKERGVVPKSNSGLSQQKVQIQQNRQSDVDDRRFPKDSSTSISSAKERRRK